MISVFTLKHCKNLRIYYIICLRYIKKGDFNEKNTTGFISNIWG